MKDPEPPPLAVRLAARSLRAAPTPAEEALWKLLRNRGCQGIKFRRQVTIRRFIADFCCPELRLIVELDGDVHLETGMATRDEARDEVLQSLGFTVLRFPNEQVFRDPEGLLSEIAALAWEKGWVPPQPFPASPSPGGWGGDGRGGPRG
jgi:very-short-patch-repair endonuclease